LKETVDCEAEPTKVEILNIEALNGSPFIFRNVLTPQHFIQQAKSIGMESGGSSPTICKMDHVVAKSIPVAKWLFGCIQPFLEPTVQPFLEPTVNLTISGPLVVPMGIPNSAESANWKPTGLNEVFWIY
jgi:hypothetical protein